MRLPAASLGAIAALALAIASVMVLANTALIVAEPPPLFEDTFKDTSRIQSMDGVLVAGGQVTLSGGAREVDPISNNVLALSLAQTGYPVVVGGPAVLRVGGTWYLYNHETFDNYRYAIYLATSSDGLSWTPRPNPVVAPAGSASRTAYPGVLYQGGLFHMWYGSYDGIAYTIFHATSTDGYTWGPGTEVLGTDVDGGVVYFSASPSVLWDGTEFRMWYWSTAPTAGQVFRYATSTDGVTWNRLGVVLRPATVDGVPMTGVTGPSVVQEPSALVMWYACATPTVGYICRARSTDGLVWDQEGIALSPNLSDPTRDRLANLPSAVRLDDGSYRIFYETRGSQSPSGAWPGDQIWSGTTTAGGPSRGSIVSVGIGAGPGGKYRSVEVSWNLPTGTSIAIDVLDDAGNPISGFSGMTSREFSLAGISGKAYPVIHLRANLIGTAIASPALLAWEVY